MMPLTSQRKRHRNLREESLILAEIRRRIEPQGPRRRGGRLQLAEDVVEGVDGDFARGVGAGVGEPDFDAAVVVGEGFEGLEGRCAAFEPDADPAGGAAGLRVEDVAGDAVGGFGGHCDFFLGLDFSFFWLS